ncbi:MAG: extracellular solute-binding protein [Geminicoccaceae bacterium]|nr:extracellular solute-binding protein [Geminicoccaceae bacterium]MCB9967967.1 extracellular solute-binding protein [Geminicoccaceae bacterium]HRY24162.1 extracellular solute-binding protein [Geminicoccaceae bacterium]
MHDDFQAKQRRLRSYLMRRRQVLHGGLAGAAAVALPGLSRRALAQADPPLSFVGWQYNPQIVEENVNIFRELYGENVNYELVPGEYHAVVETKLIGGQKIDMMYAEEDRLVRWWRANWVRDIEDLPGVPEIKAGMFDINVHNMTLPDGKLGGLPYYTGFNSFVCNQRHLDAAKLEPPATWPELLEQCRKLKADGVAEYPYMSAWQRAWASLSWSLFSIWYSEGAPVFDANFDPVFDDAFRGVLEMHRTMYDEELVPADIFTLDQEGVPAFATGNHSFMVVHEYDQKVFNDPALSQFAGDCINAVMPGQTRSTFIWTALYLMGKNPVDLERVWNLQQFFGGKAKDGKYHVATRWALEFGLGTPHKEVIESPEVQAAFGKWKNMEVAAIQQETATTRDVAKTMWFPEWDWYMMGEVQDYIRGAQETDELVDKLHDKAVELKQLYPQ